MSFQAVKLGDFNRDGRSDLLFRRNSDGLLSLYLLNGFQVSSTQTIKAIGADWNLEAVADFNGDGTSDMIFRRPSDGRLAMLLMDGGQPSGLRSSAPSA